MNKLFIVSLIALLTSCSAYNSAMDSFSGRGKISQEKSTFDGSTIVNVSPTYLYDPARGGAYDGVNLGAKWQNNLPDIAILVLSYSGSTRFGGALYLGLNGIDINIDGTKYSYKTKGSTVTSNDSYSSYYGINAKSMNVVAVPYKIFEQMLSAKDCRLRIHTSDGYEDAVFSAESIPYGGPDTAIVAMRKFDQRVQAIKRGEEIHDRIFADEEPVATMLSDDDDW